MPDWQTVKNWLYNWDDIQTLITTIDYLIRKREITKNAVDLVDMILKTISTAGAELSDEEALVYEFLTQAV